MKARRTVMMQVGNDQDCTIHVDGFPKVWSQGQVSQDGGIGRNGASNPISVTFQEQKGSTATKSRRRRRKTRRTIGIFLALGKFATAWDRSLAGKPYYQP